MHSKRDKIQTNHIANFWIILTGSASPELENTCNYETILALSLATEMEACQLAGIAFNSDASCLLPLPKQVLVEKDCSRFYSFENEADCLRNYSQGALKLKGVCELE